MGRISEGCVACVLVVVCREGAFGGFVVPDVPPFRWGKNGEHHPHQSLAFTHQPNSSLVSALIFMALVLTDPRIDTGHPWPPGQNHDPVATYAPIAPLQAPNLALLSILTAED